MYFSDEILFDKIKILSKQVLLAKQEGTRGQKAAECPANTGVTYGLSGFFNYLYDLWIDY